jgi:hypothetical protein
MSFGKQFAHSITFGDYATARNQMAEYNAFDTQSENKRLLIHPQPAAGLQEG